MMKHTTFLLLVMSYGPWAASPGIAEETPTLAIDKKSSELVPLFKALPPNECLVTSMVRRDSDDLVIGATCGKKHIGLFSFDHRSRTVTRLDRFEALWWDEPRLALGPQGDIFLASRRTYDKQFVFERLRERPHTPGQYNRRGVEPPAGEINEDAHGMPLRQYARDGRLEREIPLPESLSKDGVGALVVCADGKVLCGLSSPGGHLFTISLESGESKDYGEVVRVPDRHSSRPISKALMVGDDGKVYVIGTNSELESGGDDDVMGFILEFDPRTGELKSLHARLPAVIGRRRFAALDAVVKLDNGDFFGGTTDGYLFRFDPRSNTVECFGKPLRQHNICGLVRGPEAFIYGVGGERGGLPRLFAFDPVYRRMHLGTPPSGHSPDTFGEIGALVTTSDGTLVCGERERRGYLLVYRPRKVTWLRSFDRKGFEQCTRDRFLSLSEDRSGVELAPTFLISDAMARSSKLAEPLSDEVYAKKIFHLRGQCEQAELLFFRGGGTEEKPILIYVNGHKIRHVQDKEKMLTGGWDREMVPGAYLRRGKNELVFGQAGSLLVDTDSAGGNSFKKRGPGAAWESGILGPKDDSTGEYVVRVRVHGRPSRGVITSPVVDIAATATEHAEAVAPILQLASVRVSCEKTTPAGTWIQLEVRSGSTPEVSRPSWGAWRPAEKMDDVPLRRYVQWRAILASDHPQKTPVLRKVTLAAEGQTSGVNKECVKVTAVPDNEVAISSYAFEYPDPHHPRMRYLREKYKLDAVVADGETEAEKFALLRQWVRAQWEGWDMGSYHYCPPWDALEVLELAPKKLALGMCTHYGAVFSQCAAALGYPARVLIVDHHCLAEIWSNQYRKWILQDVGLLKGHTVAFQYEHARVPLNALEIHERSRAGNVDDVTVVPDPPVPLDQMRDQMVHLYRRFSIPLRNDHLCRPEPQEEEHGLDQYHWDGYLWWTDSLDPQYPEYSLQTDRRQDFYWTLSKTVITLTDTQERGVLSVGLSGPIPHRDKFLLRIDGGEWKVTKPVFQWHLRPGKNTLQAKAVNTMGVEGPVNSTELVYSPFSLGAQRRQPR